MRLVLLYLIYATMLSVALARRGRRSAAGATSATPDPSPHASADRVRDSSWHRKQQRTHGPLLHVLCDPGRSAVLLLGQGAPGTNHRAERRELGHCEAGRAHQWRAAPGVCW